MKLTLVINTPPHCRTFKEQFAQLTELTVEKATAPVPRVELLIEEVS